MIENQNLNPELIRGMAEDYWRTYVTVAGQNTNAAIEIRQRFEERIAATASLMPQENANAFLAAIDMERNRLCDEYERDSEAQKRRLSIQSNRNQQPSSSSHRQGMGEMVVRTAVRATIWEAIFSIFRR